MTLAPTPLSPVPITQEVAASVFPTTSGALMHTLWGLCEACLHESRYTMPVFMALNENWEACLAQCPGPS